MKDAFNEIVSVEELALTTVGMRSTHLYKLTKANGAFKLCRYCKILNRLELEAQARCTEADFIKLMNDCGVMGWDGFCGEHPKDVLDGVMFEFSVTVNDGREIKAQGFESFPQGYGELVKALDQMLLEASAAYEEKNSKSLQDFHADLTFGIEEKVCLDVNKKQLLLTVGAKPYVIDSGEIIGFAGEISEICEKDADKGYRFCIKLNVNTALFDELRVDLTKGNRPTHPDEDWYLECDMQLLELKWRLREWTFKPTVEQTFLG